MYTPIAACLGATSQHSTPNKDAEGSLRRMIGEEISTKRSPCQARHLAHGQEKKSIEKVEVQREGSSLAI